MIEVATNSRAQPFYQVDADPTSPTFGKPINPNGSGGVQTPTFARATTSGSVSAGKMAVTIANAGANAGTVLGTSLKSGEAVSFTAGDGAVLTAIAYDASGTEFTIAAVA